MAYLKFLLPYCYPSTCQKGPGSLPVPEKSRKRICVASVAVATQAVPLLPVSFENVFRHHWKAALQPASSLKPQHTVAKQL